MASCVCCFRCRWGANALDTGHVRMRDIQNVKLDTTFMGNDVVIVKNGRRICGSGGALGNAPIVQDKAYFEAKLQTSGVWGIGMATRQCNLHQVPLGNDKEAWVLRNDGTLWHNNTEKGHLPEVPQEGDVLGISYDHVEMNIYINGKHTNTPFCGIKGTVFPVLYVDDGATFDVQFSGFYHSPPMGFEEIMIEKSLL